MRLLQEFDLAAREGPYLQAAIARFGHQLLQVVPKAPELAQRRSVQCELGLQSKLYRVAKHEIARPIRRGSWASDHDKPGETLGRE